MRSRWEEGGEEDRLDEPVTITERQLRSLKRGAKAGMFAVLLGVLSLALGGWSLLAGPKELPASASVHPASETGEVQAAAPAPVNPVPAPGAAVAQQAPTAQPVRAVEPPQQVAVASPKPVAKPAARVSSARKSAPKPVRTDLSPDQPISVPVPSVTADSARGSSPQ